MEVALSEERWSVTFFADGRTAVEGFPLAPGARLEGALASLLERFPSPPDK